MQLIIVSGRSGSGKSTALHVLEDIGFTCIDNLPASLLPNLATHINQNQEKSYAISIDARNSAADLEMLPNLFKIPDVSSLNAQTLFLDAEDDCLIQRFSETRRRHPLSNPQTDLRSAMVKERELLDPIKSAATITIDTTAMNFHELRDLVKQQVISIDTTSISLLFQSFGFKFGLPRNADLVFDIRCLPNPHWKKELRSLTGMDTAVKDFLAAQPQVNEMYNDIHGYLEHWLPNYEANNRSYLTVAIGCTGGQHRSVYLCNQLTEYFGRSYTDVQCRHRELGIHS